MARAIRWREKDKAKISNYVRKFNASITKYGRKHLELSDAGVLPEKLDVSFVRSKIRTRNDFNAFIRSVDRWFKRKSAREVITIAGGIKKTKYEYQEAKYLARRVARNRERIKRLTGISDRQAKLSRLSDISVEEKEKKIAGKISDIGKKGNYNDIGNVTAEWESFIKQLFIESSERYIESTGHKYFNSYKKALRENLSAEQAKRILDLIDKMGIDAYSLFLITSSNDLADIDYVYGPEESEERTKTILENIKKTYQELREAGVL